MHSKVWQLQEAKARFSEVVNQAFVEGPQTVTRRGREAVVIVAADESRRHTFSERPHAVFRRAPYLDGVPVDGNPSLSREIDLCDS